MNKIKQAVTIQAVTREKVMKLLGLTEEQYGEYVIDHGLAYLRLHLGDNLMAKSLPQTALFWGWWRNHWHTVDMDFVDEVRKLTQAERGQYYDIVHAVEGFEFTPPRPVMQDAFKKITYKPKIVHQL
ncbi:hypothetical protein [Mucilaginibacter rubeus]|uniref:Uncharacterized protein n=1 Tax=Mucilaginibacter rubeus TaxID=2027860 RepID=A0A5C1I7C9_9SPHI|nr:hypothetical protein [Mucilaginibacter rubeus]QEM13448.1 hypothetical protein DEO27_026710 [Mucilaginibacter rubeus]